MEAVWFLAGVLATLIVSTAVALVLVRQAPIMVEDEDPLALAAEDARSTGVGVVLGRVGSDGEIYLERVDPAVYEVRIRTTLGAIR